MLVGGFCMEYFNKAPYRKTMKRCVQFKYFINIVATPPKKTNILKCLLDPDQFL